MPIEDIDYLYQNSVKENIILLIDSSKRNKQLYPKVSEFQVDFIEPFHFVYGIEVLNTTIPRTMFMIEEYNNSLSYRYGFDMLESNENRVINFIPQDFSSAEMFYSRINEQLVSNFLPFEMDNYENMFDNSLNEQRKKSDYPIIRFNNFFPFFFDMKKSSIFNILGFDQLAIEKDYNKYLTMNKVLNSFTPVIKQDLFVKKGTHKEIILEYMSKTETSRFDDGDTFNTFKFRYIHDSEYNMMSFVNQLELILDKKTVYDGNQNIRISMINVTNDKKIFSNLEDSLFNKSIENSKFPNENMNFFPSIPNIQFVLKKNDTYEIQIDNVFISKNDVNTYTCSLKLGYSYVIDINNLDIENQSIFLSKPIYSSETITMISKIGDNINKTQLNVNTPYTFYLNFNESEPYLQPFKSMMALYSVSSIKSFNIFVAGDLNVDSNDIFILSIWNEYNETSIYLGSLSLTYIYDSVTEKYMLSCINDNIETSIFSYIDMKMSNDPNLDNYVDKTRLKFELRCCTKAIQLLGLDDDLTYNIEYVFFKEFGLSSPGMLNLASENYIILRCDEIENHLRGSYDVKENSPGLGVLNIDVQGYASGRTEFYSVNYKEFHPIGKLNKLKFRFERKSDGELYDFKNIDLHFILNIKFLRPKQKQLFEKSILNPNYNPNYLNYFNKTMQDLYEEESSDDDSEIAEEYFTSQFNDIENELIHQQNNI